MFGLSLHNLKLSRLGFLFYSTKPKLYLKAAQIQTDSRFDQLVKKIAPKLIYNTVVDKYLSKLEFSKPKNQTDPLPITLKYLYESKNEKDDENRKPIHFPYEQNYKLESEESKNLPLEKENTEDVAEETNAEMRQRYNEYRNWMSSYDNYVDTDLIEEVNDSEINYGTPDPTSQISNVPCGGCGALLHCKDTAIPGYIPSEIYKNSDVPGSVNLQETICQRCHFLKYYNLALEIQVDPMDYPKVLSTIRRKKCLVILLVDLLDFPCSIWPGIGEIFNNKTPIIIVGNKIDLLPQDSKQFLKHIKSTLLDSVKNQGFATFNIKDIALISAKTGFGIEDLITKLNSLYKEKGDVYIVGCTNVGKSSLFNIFLQSDYCKTQALDLIQRATTSVWPGTTLNLLKFPIKRPIGYRQYLRFKRLQKLEKIQADERKFRIEQLKRTKNFKYATLIGHFGVTKIPNENFDNSIIPPDLPTPKIGINENQDEFKLSKWCFDTPGVVQPDQIIHLLTTEELLLTLPKDLISPRTFCIKPQSTIFIGGLARLDYLEGESSLKISVFASNLLPVTICDVENAEEIYRELFGSELFKVPKGSQERLNKFPKLEAGHEFHIIGEDWYKSVNDVVLSNAGWIALTGRKSHKYKLKPWTPEKRGIYLRNCLLPFAVALTGKRVNHSVAYHKHRFFTQI